MKIPLMNQLFRVRPQPRAVPLTDSSADYTEGHEVHVICAIVGLCCRSELSLQVHVHLKSRPRDFPEASGRVISYAPLPSRPHLRFPPRCRSDADYPPLLSLVG